MIVRVCFHLHLFLCSCGAFNNHSEPLADVFGAGPVSNGLRRPAPEHFECLPRTPDSDQREFVCQKVVAGLSSSVHQPIRDP